MTELVIALIMVGSAQARAPVPTTCDKLRPEQRLSAEREQQVKSAISFGMRGLKGAGAVDTSTTEATEIRVLRDDDLARGWFIYQTCIMREANMIDEGLAQQLVCKVMGIACEEPSPPSIQVVGRRGGLGAVVVKGPHPEAQITIDGASRGALGSGFSARVSPGTHQVRITAKGFKPLETTVQVTAGADAIVAANLERRRVNWKLVGIISGAALIAIIVAAIAAGSATGGGYGYGYGYGYYY